MNHIFNGKKFLSLGVLGLLLTGLVDAQEQAAVSTDVLLRSSTSWDGAPYAPYSRKQPELSVLKITIPAHTQLPWHTHPMPNAAYVVSGELTVEKKESGEKKTLIAGEVLPEMVGELHRGVTGDTPVELIVFYAGAKDLPVSQH